jgi:hypothetical protein
MKANHHELVKYIKFDKKEDAEHFAKNQSATDSNHGYDVQKSNKGEFTTIKSYLNGQESEMI